MNISHSLQKDWDDDFLLPWFVAPRGLRGAHPVFHDVQVLVIPRGRFAIKLSQFDVHYLNRKGRPAGCEHVEVCLSLEGSLWVVVFDIWRRNGTSGDECSTGHDYYYWGRHRWIGHAHRDQRCGEREAGYMAASVHHYKDYSDILPCWGEICPDCKDGVPSALHTCDPLASVKSDRNTRDGSWQYTPCVYCGQLFWSRHGRLYCCARCEKATVRRFPVGIPKRISGKPGWGVLLPHKPRIGDIIRVHAKSGHRFRKRVTAIHKSTKDGWLVEAEPPAEVSSFRYMIPLRCSTETLPMVTLSDILDGTQWDEEDLERLSLL